jgi:hypothetical protein
MSQTVTVSYISYQVSLQFKSEEIITLALVLISVFCLFLMLVWYIL